jgi:ubiquinone/menaquinone biosynthesis C-methylase UbiE
MPPLEPEDLLAEETLELAERPASAALLPLLQLKPGLRYLEVGCGAGASFFKAFELMGGVGVFLAAELQEERLRRFLTRLEAYAEHPGYMRIEVVRAKPDRLPLPDHCADRVLLAQGLPAGQEPRAYIRELHRLLSPGGLLCLCDACDDEDGAARLDERDACEALQAAGFRLLVSHAGFDRHWCLTAVR